MRRGKEEGREGGGCRKVRRCRYIAEGENGRGKGREGRREGRRMHPPYAVVEKERWREERRKRGRMCMYGFYLCYGTKTGGGVVVKGGRGGREASVQCLK